MFNRRHPFFPKDIIDIYVFWVAGVSHAVITDEDNIDDVSKVPGLQAVV